MRTNRHDFINFLRHTLAPDLRESGSLATAADIEAACLFIEGAAYVRIDSETGTAEEES